MNKKTETIRRTDSIDGQVASLSRLGQAEVRKIKFGHQLIELDLREKILKLGLDLHYRQVTVGMQEDGSLVRVVGKMGYTQFLRWIRKKLVEGWQIYSCYEAGASGYWLHRKLVDLGGGVVARTGLERVEAKRLAQRVDERTTGGLAQ
jgi:hypothetical protein